ncbi:hypothetical protein JHK82_028357 [Glycine max]|nr:hypothetical protein JHK82_028357 [Glycine max]
MLCRKNKRPVEEGTCLAGHIQDSRGAPPHPPCNLVLNDFLHTVILGDIDLPQEPFPPIAVVARRNPHDRAIPIGDGVQVMESSPMALFLGLIRHNILINLNEPPPLWL